MSAGILLEDLAFVLAFDAGGSGRYEHLARHTNTAARR